MEISVTSFILTCAVMELTPGPNMSYLALISATQGRRAGLITVLGISLGLLTLGSFAVYSINLLVQILPILNVFLRWVGGLYMLWLAWQSWCAADKLTEIKTTETSSNFYRGFITNLLNPKALTFYLSVLPQFIDLYSEKPLINMAALMLISVLIATFVHFLIVLFSSQAQHFLTTSNRYKSIHRIFALLLILIAIWIII